MQDEANMYSLMIAPLKDERFTMYWNNLKKI
jgi:hypothetical protein